MFHWLNEHLKWGGWTSGGRFFTACFAMAIGLAILFWLMSRPKSEKPATWAQAMAGTTGTFALFFLAYGVIPSEFIIWGNSYWELGDRSWFIVKSSRDIPLLGIHWPFSITFSVLEDLIVVLIYLFFFGLNLYVFSAWQKRGTKQQEETAEGVPTRRSRFGRPLKTTGA
jgi:hypothetical protein